MPRELFVYDHPHFEAVARRYRLAVRRGDAALAERCRRELRRLADENALREQVAEPPLVLPFVLSEARRAESKERRLA